MRICCSELSLLLLQKWDDSCVHVCCEGKLNSKHIVHLIFKGKAETRSSPFFPFHLEGKKKREKNGVGVIRQLSFVTVLFTLIKP